MIERLNLAPRSWSQPERHQRRRAAGLLFALWLQGAAAADPDRAQQGRRLAQAGDKGNCLACHQIPGDTTGVSQANIGPPLIGLRERFPRRRALELQIWDASQANPDTVMPPFGRNQILSAEEIERIAEYLYQY